MSIYSIDFARKYIFAGGLSLLCNSLYKKFILPIYISIRKVALGETMFYLLGERHDLQDLLLFALLISKGFPEEI